MYDSLIPLIAVLLCTFWGPVVLSAQGHHLMNAGMDRLMWFGGKLFYINTWAMIWPTDYAAHKWKMKKRKKLTLNLAVYDTSDAATWIQHILQKKNDRRNKDKQTPNRAAHNTWKYIPHTYNTYRYIQIHTDTYQIWTEFFWLFYLIVWSMYCMYRFKIHAHKYTYCVLFNFYVCMCIYLYVCVCIFCGKTRRRVDTDTYIHIHAHTYKFSKKYIHIKQKYIPYTY